MEEEKLRELFKDFSPSLPSDSQFLSRLQRGMERVEIVKRHAETVRRHNRIAVMVAAVVGFAMGVILSLLFPLIGDAVSSFDPALPDIGIFDIHIDWRMTGWVVIAAASVLTAINAYEITISRLSAKDLRVS